MQFSLKYDLVDEKTGVSVYGDYTSIGSGEYIINVVQNFYKKGLGKLRKYMKKEAKEA